MMRHLLSVFILTACLSACGKDGQSEGAGAATTAPAQASKPLLISPEDLLTVRSTASASGPSITGSVQPERRADLRAEISAVVLEVLKENGDAVQQGDLLVRLDDTAIRDSLTSAEASARAASQAYEQAERQFRRMTQLRESRLVSAQELEDTEIRRNNAQSDLQAARTTRASARQQLQRTEVRAPFDGIVSDRQVSAGDTAQIGKELLKVIDPRSMRFEGRVSADHVGEIEAGQRVSFRVQGLLGEELLGRITRVNPAANATTRQIEVLVDFLDAEQQPKLAGLYAEGRVETPGAGALTIASTAVVTEGDRAFVWRLDDHALQKVSVRLGQRDARTGAFVLRSGLSEGDQVLRYPTSTLEDGQKLELAAATPPPAASARAP